MVKVGLLKFIKTVVSHLNAPETLTLTFLPALKSWEKKTIIFEF